MAHPNMSYCMFENTLAALRQCADELGEPASMQEELSETEANAKESLVELCCEIAEQCGNTRDYSVEDAVEILKSHAKAMAEPIKYVKVDEAIAMLEADACAA